MLSLLFDILPNAGKRLVDVDAFAINDESFNLNILESILLVIAY